MQAASAVLGNLLLAADRTIAEGVQLRSAAAAAAASDDHGALTEAPRIAQLCAAMRDQLRRLGTEVAACARSGGVGGRGYVSVLRLVECGKAMMLDRLPRWEGSHSCAPRSLSATAPQSTLPRDRCSIWSRSCCHRRRRRCCCTSSETFRSVQPHNCAVMERH